MAQFVPLPFSPARTGQAATLQDSLWQVPGAVRQSIVGLYRAERVLLPLPTGANSAQTALPASPGAAASQSAASAPQSAASAPTAMAPAGTAAPPVPVPQSAVEPGSTIDANLEMRVAIARNISTLNVGVSTSGYLMDLNGQNYCNIPAQTSYVARPTGQGIDFGNCQLSTAVWLEPSEGGYIYIGDSWFKGRVLLLNDGGNLLAVNYVLLHDYLSSVVGTEMFVNWPIEALKAQAVAARSYALTHHVRPASRHFDLDNTERFQAYKGIAKETNTTQIAVAETSGEFISYNGGIVESLYAASDQIVQEAHGGQGMSQTGAMQLASQGYGYSQILANYYPGTGLSRLVIE
ncbi:MAG: SpoIID/LytB domain-containing protein [Cyanobacteria bacterium Co-bin13]|nr:SpoIID/LytB domain-containing protein [Cyanobacteria bacterium Co-bin13]